MHTYPVGVGNIKCFKVQIIGFNLASWAICGVILTCSVIFFLHYLSSFHNFLKIFSICLWEELHCLVLGASTSGNRVVMLKRLRFICIVTIIIIVMTIMDSIMVITLTLPPPRDGDAGRTISGRQRARQRHGTRSRWTCSWGCHWYRPTDSLLFLGFRSLSPS